MGEDKEVEKKVNSKEGEPKDKSNQPDISKEEPIEAEKPSEEYKNLFLQRVRKALTPGSSEGIPANVSDLLDSIALNAYESKASDIHIEPEEDRVFIRYRIDGILRDVLTLEKEIEQPLLFKIKINSKLPTDEHFAPQDGRITFMFDKVKLDTRISILPTSKGEKVVIRLLASDGKDLSLEDLGIVGDKLEAVKRAYSKPYGMILTVGPTGSGKTTTLYSILKLLNSREVNITTVEDPVEYSIKGVNHVQINTRADLTFANGLRAILRQDPNIIMIGEIRDAETAKIAINAAMTGHMVLSSLHTNDAITTIPRLIDMEVEEFLVASTLNIVIAQRLARRLCEKCKTKYSLSAEEHEEIGKIRSDLKELLKPGEEFYKETGCSECSTTGFKGRIGLYEILEVKKEIRKLISEKANVDDIFKLAREQGLVLIVEDGINKLREGTISISELMRVTAVKE